MFHDERVDLATAADPWEALAERNWRTWLYDPTTAAAAPVEALDWNSGATYVFHVDGSHYVMVPSTDYAETSVVTLASDLHAANALTMRG